MYGEALYKPEMKEGNPIRLYSLDEITEIFCKLGLTRQEASNYNVGDEVVVDLPTRTIEGTIGYVGETDVRIDRPLEVFSTLHNCSSVLNGALAPAVKPRKTDFWEGKHSLKFSQNCS